MTTAEWIVSFSVKGDDPSKWFALTSQDRVLPVLGFLDDEGDSVPTVGDAYVILAGANGLAEFAIPVLECSEKSDN